MTYDFKMYDVEFSEEYVEMKLKKEKIDELTDRISSLI